MAEYLVTNILDLRHLLEFVVLLWKVEKLLGLIYSYQQVFVSCVVYVYRALGGIFPYIFIWEDKNL